ncbi:sesquipedalian-2 [Gracilinanus agilis]|uniref:sesquipedalian-2 n=1 Tax=Gracilinanus agilis TaxID=191870 RepID=UPI001CFE31AF|nr:sesquipedalian-2 [Gracilinanus agilis]XP_044534186.1 sesquipedalian-2 [Gracilinanus agilis]
MKLNEPSVAHYAVSGSPADHEGFLHRCSSPGPRQPSAPSASGSCPRCWFVLKGNLLFYFEARESRSPLGLIVLEGSTVELCEAPQEFAFAIRFASPGMRPYVLAAEDQEDQEAWVKVLSRASFGYMRLLVQELEGQLREMQLGLASRASCSPPGPQAGAGPPPHRPPPEPEEGCPGLGDGLPLADAEWDEGGPRFPAPSTRRRLAENYPWGSACLPLNGGDSPVSPETSCFSKLHDWYGQEIIDLRREWLQARALGGGL